MTEALVSMQAYRIEIPEARRLHTADVFRLAADAVQTQALNGNLELAVPEMALAAAAGAYPVPQPWILPLFRDVLGLSPRDLAEWNRRPSLIGASFVLRAFAHAVENRDL